MHKRPQHRRLKGHLKLHIPQLSLSKVTSTQRSPQHINLGRSSPLLQINGLAAHPVIWLTPSFSTNDVDSMPLSITSIGIIGFPSILIKNSTNTNTNIARAEHCACRPIFRKCLLTCEGWDRILEPLYKGLLREVSFLRSQRGVFFLHGLEIWTVLNVVFTCFYYFEGKFCQLAL